MDPGIRTGTDLNKPDPAKIPDPDLNPRPKEYQTVFISNYFYAGDKKHDSPKFTINITN